MKFNRTLRRLGRTLMFGWRQAQPWRLQARSEQLGTDLRELAQATLTRVRDSYLIHAVVVASVTLALGLGGLGLGEPVWTVLAFVLAFALVEAAYLSVRLSRDFGRAQRVPTPVAAFQCAQVVSGQYARTVIPVAAIAAAISVGLVYWMTGPTENSLPRLLVMQALLLCSRIYMLGSLERLHALLAGTRRPRPQTVKKTRTAGQLKGLVQRTGS